MGAVASLFLLGLSLFGARELCCGRERTQVSLEQDLSRGRWPLGD